MKFIIKDFFFACVASVVLYYLVVASVGIAAALAIPNGYIEWFRKEEILKFGVYLWSVMTIIPAQAIPTIIITYIIARFLVDNVKVFCAALILIYIIYYAVEYRGFGSLGVALIYPLSIVLAGYLAQKVRAKKSISD
ncbi:hypothetical protein [Kangiella marina]|uniref:Uncharacterized protein n=1 Tax=Kangiella marina TaxID=1079178 RepID=A0ABP8IMY2_9GAMM